MKVGSDENIFCNILYAEYDARICSTVNGHLQWSQLGVVLC